MCQILDNVSAALAMSIIWILLMFPSIRNYVSLNWGMLTGDNENLSIHTVLLFTHNISKDYFCLWIISYIYFKLINFLETILIFKLRKIMVINSLASHNPSTKIIIKNHQFIWQIFVGHLLYLSTRM